MLIPLLTTFSWQELRHHPWRNAAAVVSVMLGVALAFAVHLINSSALDEFSQAARSVGGQPDLELRSAGNVDLALWGRLLQHPDVELASPVLELQSAAVQDGRKLPLRLLGVDALQVALVAPDLLPRPGSDADRLAIFAPDTVFLNPTARQALTGPSLQVQLGLRLHTLHVAGSVQASGPAVAVMDIGALQSLLGREAITRVDLRLRAGVDRQTFVETLEREAGWPTSATLREPGDASARINQLSRAYRVNLTVLALVALFTGGFLVFSVLALSVARRSQQFALLAVLGLTGPQRSRLVLMEAAVLGTLGSILGLALGTALAALALQLLGGDLGGGYFAGSAPALQWSGGAALLFGGLGVAAALFGAWAPAQQAQGLPPAQTLKGLGHEGERAQRAWLGLTLLLGAGAMALLPPIWDIPLAAYASVACLLLGGISVLPSAVGWLLKYLAPTVRHHALPLLAVERARRVRESAAVAVSGVVAALSLAVALTVMVASFRQSVSSWLDAVLPADLYVRAANATGSNDAPPFSPDFLQAAAELPAVARLSAQRSLQIALEPGRPAVTLLVRPLSSEGTTNAPGNLPLLGPALPVPPGRVGIYVSEATRDLYGAEPGSDFPLLSGSFKPPAPVEHAPKAMFFVAGVWRDYSRQFGTITMDSQDFARFSQDTQANDIAFWLHPHTTVPEAQDQLRTLANRKGNTPGGEAGALLEFGSAAEIRTTSLKIFDRSFAVTYWLQAVAIGIGLFGVAASFSAQVLARRKEFGLLAHLGLTRGQILRVVALEGAAWTTLGALAGVALGLAVAVVLVHVVNPQSFHWTMDLALPWGRLLALGAAVVAAGTTTAWLSGQAAAGRDAVMAVKEDW